MNPAPDRPRKLQDKEIAAAIGVHAHTLTRWKQENGLRLPPWPRTMGDCLAAIRDWREKSGAAFSARPDAS